jgi:HCOMODA/2-hydroxy-3-carboxy-muconic semialdehyde decarboxylase
MTEEVGAALLDAARIVSWAGLSDAFGHVSTRTSDTSFAMTPVTPLGLLDPGFEPVTVELSATELPPRAPKEAWLHIALMGDRPEIGSVCRAQPPSVAAVAALGIDLIPLNGHGAVLGEIAVFPASWLVREQGIGKDVQTAMGDAPNIILRGNGAVTRGASLAEAVSRMWLLERSAELTLKAWAAGTPRPLPADEAQWWEAQSGELLPRIYNYLSKTCERDHR